MCGSPSVSTNMKLEVLQAIVRDIAVLVVNGFVVEEFTSEVLRHDVAVLKDVATRTIRQRRPNRAIALLAPLDPPTFPGVVLFCAMPASE